MGNNVTLLRYLRSSKFKKDSVILITGASRGIGKELAIQYAQRKCRLFLTARNEKDLQEVTKVCRELDSECHYLAIDVNKSENCKLLVDTCIKTYGELDILVLNAGVGAHIQFEDIENFELFEKIFQTNFYHYVYMTKYALQHLKKNKGQILVVSSMSGEFGFPARTAYCASKFAVNGFFESLRTEISYREVAISIVCPPSVKTDLRKYDLAKAMGMKSVITDENQRDTRIAVEECVKTILDAADRRARKIYFPFKTYFGVYLRPFFPDIVDHFALKEAKLQLYIRIQLFQYELNIYTSQKQIIKAFFDKYY